MERDRRRYYVTGLSIGLAVAALFAFGPKTSPEQRVAADIAILAAEPWDSITVLSEDFQGPQQSPTDVLVRGVRPNGTDVMIHFAADSPYTSPRAIRVLQESPRTNIEAEILMVPRSLVLSDFRARFNHDATHAGVAVYVPTPAPVVEGGDSDMQPMHEESNDG